MTLNQSTSETHVGGAGTTLNQEPIVRGQTDIRISLWELAIIAGLMVAAVGSVPAQILSLPEYTHVVLPEIFGKDKHSWDGPYCYYSNQGVTSLGYIAPAFIWILSLITPSWLCPLIPLRTLLLFSCGLVFVGSIIALVAHISTYVIGAFLMGVGAGISNMVFQIYIGESSPVETRATLDRVYNGSVAIGLYGSSMLVYVMSNKYITWRLDLFIPMASSGVLFLLVLPLRYHVKYTQQPYREIWRRELTPSIVTGILSKAFGALLGSPIVLSFLPPVYDVLGIPRERYFLYIMILGVVIVSALAASCYLFDRFGRRRALLLGSGHLFISLGLVAFMQYSYIAPSQQSQRLLGSSFTSTPSLASSIFSILFLYCAIFSFTLCFGLTGWLSSPFPDGITWVANALSSTPNTIVSFVLAIASPFMVCKFGPNVFTFHAVVAFIMFVFVLFLIPETRQMTYENIEAQVWREHWLWRRFIQPRGEILDSLPLA